MVPDDLDRVKAAHAAALRLPHADRRAYLEQVFPNDPEVRGEVEKLLAWHDEAGEFLTRPLASKILDPLAPDVKKLRLGPYELIRELGRGGSATVYLARRADDLFEKLVAMKVLNRLAHSEETFLRFQREIQILASVEHRYIVRLLDAGTTGEALAYIVTEFVEGERLDSFAARLPLSERLLLFLNVCEGVAAAHQNLIVHRDLKPTNILVTPDGDPKLLDFGIAVLLDDTERLTETGFERMSVHYASPEQLRGEKLITTATDVYSLGVLLYEMISGSHPYEFPKHELATRIQSEDPLPLKSAPRELSAIVQKAMQKEASRRYESVDRFRDDLSRFLNNEPVSAHGNGTVYRVKKFARKYWLGIATASIAVVVLSTLTIVSIASSRRAERQSARITELLSTGLDKLPANDFSRNSLRGLRVVGEIRNEYLNSLLQEYPDNIQIAKLRFQALRALGVVQGLPSTLNLGETANAAENLEKAIELGEHILAKWREGMSIRPALSLAYIELGSVLLEMNRREAALTKFVRANELSISGAADAGGRIQLEVLAQRSRILGFSGQIEEALALRRQVVGGRRILFEKQPDALRWEYAGALCSYGELLRESGRYTEAEKCYAQGLPMIEDLVRTNSRVLEHSWHLARENEEYAKVLLSLGRIDLAKERLNRAISLYREVRQEEPYAMSNERALAMCLDLLGSQMAAHGDLPKGRPLLEEAFVRSKKCVRADPGSFRVKDELSTITGDLARLNP